ncbi:MAG: arginase family protein [Spirochaetota bacterium]
MTRSDAGRNLTSRGRVALLGLPADEHSSHLRGAAAAPPAIRAALASPSSNLWAENGVDIGAKGMIADLGDLPLGGKLDLEAIEAGARGALAAAPRAIFLGGDHSVSWLLLRALSESRGKNLTVLHFDAHPDLYDSFEGDRLSHACPFARVMEEGLVSRLVQVGIRGMNSHQAQQARRFGVEVINMEDWTSGKRPAIEGELYISLDLDALDPAFAPGVSHPEPGGLSTREIITAINCSGGTLRAADIVELNPSRDPSGLSAMVAAKLLKELAGRMILEGGA